MPVTPEELEAATQPTNIPDDPKALAAARGDFVGEKPAEEAEKPELTEAEKEEVAAVVEEKPAEEAKAETEEPSRDPETGKFIPKTRFDELRRKKDTRIAALEAREKELLDRVNFLAGPTNIQEAEKSLEAKTEEYQNLLADGKLEEAARVFKDISKLNRDIAKLELQPAIRELSSAPVRAQSIADVIDFYTAEFPEFRAGAQEYSQDLVNEVAELQAGFEAQNYSPATALSKAADLVVRANQLMPATERSAPPAKADKAGERKAGAVKAAVDASARQPPNLKAVGTDSDKMGAANVDVNALSFEEFSKLPESTIRRLRGDFAA